MYEFYVENCKCSYQMHKCLLMGADKHIKENLTEDKAVGHQV